MINAILQNPLAATLLCYAWSLVFCYVWLYQVSWNVLRIPIEMVIIAYPFLFSLPVLLLTGGYELALPFLAQWLNRPEIAASFAGRVGFPCVVISVLLCLFYPMGRKGNYVIYLFRHLRGRD